MENWQLALVIISAVLVGSLIPLISTYRATLKRLDSVIQENEKSFKKAVYELAEFSTRLNKLGALAESKSKNVDHIMESIEGITETIQKISGSMKTASMVGAAVAPAVTAAIKAYQHKSNGHDANSVEDDNDLAWVEPREGEERRS